MALLAAYPIPFIITVIIIGIVFANQKPYD